MPFVLKSVASRSALTAMATIWLLASAGEAQAQSFFKRVIDGVKQNLNLTAGANNATLPGGLEHIFANHPFDPDQSLAAQYPRVAFVVATTPPKHNEIISANNVGAPYNHMCWTISATIWNSRNTNTVVQPFQACIPELVEAPAKDQVPLLGYMNWFGVKASLRNAPARGTTTGVMRTSGPTPPIDPFPQGIMGQRYFGSVLSVAGPLQSSGEAWLWASILYHMDFDPMQLDDRRVWLVSVP